MLVTCGRLNKSTDCLYSIHRYSVKADNMILENLEDPIFHFENIT